MLNAKGKIRNLKSFQRIHGEVSANHSSFRTDLLEDVAAVHR
jgi:hypothetical protein